MGFYHAAVVSTAARERDAHRETCICLFYYSQCILLSPWHALNACQPLVWGLVFSGAYKMDVFTFSLKASHWIPVCLRWGLLNLMRKKCLNALSRLCVVPVGIYPEPDSPLRTAKRKDKQGRVFLLLAPLPPLPAFLWYAVIRTLIIV